jgi:hypothetical protein
MFSKSTGQSKNRFSPILLKWLGIPDKSYSINEIKEAIYQKCNTDENGKKSLYVNLDNEGKMLFQVVNNPTRIQTILTCIGYKYLINYQKPPCDHYEYNQVPSNVVTLKL